MVAGLATAFAACGDDDTAYCVDNQNNVVNNSQCGDEYGGGGGGFFWLYGAHALHGNTIRRGTKLTGATTKIVSTNKAAIISRGGFGKSGGSTSGVGRASGSSSSGGS